MNNQHFSYKKKLDEFWDFCIKNQYFNIGYPESADFDYSDLYRFFQFSINNCGNWDERSNYLLNTFKFEKDVLTYFTKIFQIPYEKAWGYVTHGGTEGNLFGIYLARELFPNGYLYYSEESHYSIVKIAKLLRIKAFQIPSLPTGEINIDILTQTIKQQQDISPIIFANIGSTMLGAVDNIIGIQNQLLQLGLKRDNFYIHADAALSGMILPFVDNPQPFTFTQGIDSISVSGHKMIGSPIPCGIVVAKKNNISTISEVVEYIASTDQTISGSRNGHTVLLIWKAIHHYSFNDWKKRINSCLEMAEYAINKFKSAGINAWRNTNSITVVFPKPTEKIWKKYGFAVSKQWAHLITTSHHNSKERLDIIINDVIQDLKNSPKELL
ncbi:histidine decarboxylase [Pelistega sp. NLN82]|uniref:Histidine decarboxylase n=2 Tax=Pelistega ratti TaxID=2652177 RepID=A0A6L9Y549_9BURK|nr:histidine decarboxylase [Pelistega ratti]